jgi:hypothetical protein
MSFKFPACLRGQSAVISSDHSNSLASMPYRWISRSNAISTRTAALVALDPKHRELADQVAEDDGAFTGHITDPTNYPFATPPQDNG